MTLFFDVLLSLSALIILEIILGIDNLVFLSILTEQLPKNTRHRARQWGLSFALVTRLLLLAAALWLTHLTTPLIQISDLSFSVRDFFLLCGGGFLITKATQEIHNEMSVYKKTRKYHLHKKFYPVVFQIAIMDLIFSLDSVLTAVGLTSNFFIMATAITIAIGVMLYASKPVSHFITQYPTIKMLALAFLILIGMVLVADGLSFYIPRGYVYFAMGFSLGVEALNLIKRAKPRNVKKKD
jgi:predicted tellurium resistance membrane protein TerC